MGATHLFISTRAALQLDLQYAKVEANYRIKLPNNSIVDCPVLLKHTPIAIGESTFPRDLIQFDLLDFDIILGMKFLRAYEAKIHCWNLKVLLAYEKG